MAGEWRWRQRRRRRRRRVGRPLRMQRGRALAGGRVECPPGEPNAFLFLGLRLSHERDRGGGVALRALARAFEVARGEAAASRDALGLGRLFLHAPWLLASQSIQVLDPDVARQPQLPVLVRTELVGLGRVTFELRQTMHTHGDASGAPGPALASVSGTYICTRIVEGEGEHEGEVPADGAAGPPASRSRRAAELPEWFRDLHRGVPGLDPALQRRVETGQGARVLHTHRVLCRASDTDTNGHVNHASFLEYFLDALSGMTGAGVPPLLSLAGLAPLAPDAVKSATLRYDREAFAGDALDVEVTSPSQGVARMRLVRAGQQDRPLCLCEVVVVPEGPRALAKL